MLEYRNVKTDPSEEDFYVKNLLCFGYKYEGSREVYNEGVKKVGETRYLVQQGNGPWQEYGSRDVFENTKTNYIVMNFSRDTKIKHYQELKELEKEFDKHLSEHEYSVWCINRLSKPVLKTVKKKIGLALTIFGGALLLLVCSLGLSTLGPIALLICLLVGAPFIIPGIIFLVLGKRDVQIYDSELYTYNRKLKELEEAKSVAYENMLSIAEKGRIIIDSDE